MIALATLDFDLFTIGGTRVTLVTALSVALVLVATLWISRLARKALRRFFRSKGEGLDGTGEAISSLAHYLILGLGLTIALDTAGVDFGALFAAGAVFAVGVGFAMQNIAQNFVSGVILLAERTIRPGDVLEIDGTVARVERMGIRATVVRSRDGDQLLVPNSALVQSTVVNYTLDDPTHRIRARVGVSYDSEMRIVMETLLETARGLSWGLDAHPPQVILVEFASSSVDWEVAVCTDRPWEARLLRSELLRAIWDAFAERGITIAFPQLDVHLDAPASEGVAHLAAGGASPERAQSINASR